MRRWLLILMVALLPLRGWVGDVMAMEMAAGSMAHAGPSTQIAPNSIANYQESSGTQALFDSESVSQKHADCPGHAEAAGAETDASAAADSGHDGCSACTTCQVCHSVALAGVVEPPPSNALHFETPRTSETAFASALPARGDKPPIS
jgi:hypothetical protein